MAIVLSLSLDQVTCKYPQVKIWRQIARRSSHSRHKQLNLFWRHAIQRKMKLKTEVKEYF